jgi:hypothetical protein
VILANNEIGMKESEGRRPPWCLELAAILLLVNFTTDAESTVSGCCRIYAPEHGRPAQVIDEQGPRSTRSREKASPDC